MKFKNIITRSTPDDLSRQTPTPDDLSRQTLTPDDFSRQTPTPDDLSRQTPTSDVQLPLLFLLYTSELFYILENRLIGYADDSTLMAVVPSPCRRSCCGSRVPEP